jgi:hypothetical protein
VNRDLLLYKLLELGIDGGIYNSIKSLYTNNRASVKINNKFTSSFLTSCGVRQGDPLSPTLFNVYINDLLLGLETLNCGIEINSKSICSLAYADDIVLLAQHEKDMEKLLDYTVNWIKTWKLEINVEKSAFIHFRPKRMNASNCDFKINNNVLQRSNQYTYLGVCLTEHLDYKHLTDILANSAGRALGALIGKFIQFPYMGYQTYYNIFNTCVLPIMQYCASVWGYQEYSKCENVQLRAGRIFLGLNRFVANLAVRGDLGWVTCRTLQKLCMLRYWNRLLCMSDNNLAKLVFLWDYSLCYVNSWSHEVCLVLDGLGLSDHFENIEILDINI